MAPLAAMLLLSALAPSGQERTSAGTVPPLFTSYELVTATLEAPLGELFENGRQRTDYAVTGKLTVTDRASGASTGSGRGRSTGSGQARETRIEPVRVTTRGHTSLRESECEFPKLKIELGGAKVQGMIFQGMAAVKVGTHCSDRPDGPAGKYGRWPNQKTAHREAFVYRLLETMNIPALHARPARITYVDSGNRGAAPVERDAMLLEDDGEALKRFEARSELPPKQFGSAPSVFATRDLARLFFGQAMIGNFDWCLRMSPRDTYRCNDTTPIWNVLGLLRADGTAVPVIHDFDIAGMVTTRHLWFSRVFNRAYAGSEAEVEVIAQVQRTRSVFPRDVLDSTRRDLAGRKAAAYRALEESVMDEGGRSAAKSYLNAFFAAIETDESFYRPVIVARTPVFLKADGSSPACPDQAAVGTPVGPVIETSGDKSRVVVLDALWQWAEKCDPVRLNPVWVPTAAISRAYPQ